MSRRSPTRTIAPEPPRPERAADGRVDHGPAHVGGTALRGSRFRLLGVLSACRTSRWRPRPAVPGFPVAAQRRRRPGRRYPQTTPASPASHARAWRVAVQVDPGVRLRRCPVQGPVRGRLDPRPVRHPASAGPCVRRLRSRQCSWKVFVDIDAAAHAPRSSRPHFKSCAVSAAAPQPLYPTRPVGGSGGFSRNGTQPRRDSAHVLLTVSLGNRLQSREESQGGTATKIVSTTFAIGSRLHAK